jgi:hypothetical protein
VQGLQRLFWSEAEVNAAELPAAAGIPRSAQPCRADGVSFRTAAAAIGIVRVRAASSCGVFFLSIRGRGAGDPDASSAGEGHGRQFLRHERDKPSPIYRSGTQYGGVPA